MIDVDETVREVQRTLPTLADGEAIAVYRDGRRAVVPLELLRRPSPERPPGEEGPLDYFVPGTRMPDEEVRDRLNTALHAEPRGTFQAG